MGLAEMNKVLKFVFSDDKHRALMDFTREYNVFAQLAGQVGRPAVEQYADGGGWPDPDAEVTINLEPLPDFDWWEPRHDQPWRRQDHRRREIGLDF